MITIQPSDPVNQPIPDSHLVNVPATNPSEPTVTSVDPLPSYESVVADVNPPPAFPVPGGFGSYAAASLSEPQFNVTRMTFPPSAQTHLPQTCIPQKSSTFYNTLSAQCCQKRMFSHPGGHQLKRL